MKIRAMKVNGRELLPGDLFSTADQRYWDSALSSDTLGERVYIRMLTLTPEDQMDTDIYRIEIER